MNEVWNLDRIYHGFDDPAFAADFSALKEEIAAFAAFTENLGACEPLTGLREGIHMQENISKLANRMGLYASLR